MKRAIKSHSRDFIAIVFLLVLSIAVSAYILVHERLRFPLIQSSPLKMYADLSTAQAFTPGQGQSVRVSGVEIGQIGQVKLQNGTGLIEMDIDEKYKNVIHTDATALARPRTGLQDMFLEVNPGTPRAPVAKEGFTIPVSQTLPEVNLDEFEAALDADTRAYLNLLINGAGPALKLHGGGEIARLLERFLPTHRDLARLNSAVALRGTSLQRLVNSLQRLNGSLASNQANIVRLVDSSATVFRAFASENTNVSRAIADLPGTLRQTTATLARVQSFANLLGPTATKLLPAARSLPAVNAALKALAIPSTPIIKNQIRPFVIASRPLVRNLRPAAVNLAKATPNFGRVFTVLNHLFNMLGYNPGDSPTGGQHGYLWWLAWQDHEARTLFSLQDPNGTFRPLFVQVSCAQLEHSFTGLPSAASSTIISILALKPVQNICTTLGLSGAKAAATPSRDRKPHPGTSLSSTGTSSSSNTTASAGTASRPTSSSTSSTSSTTSSSSGTSSVLAGAVARLSSGGGH